MTNVFTLDDLNKAIETKYAPFYFSTPENEFTLRPLLRLAKSERELVTLELKKLEGMDEDNMDEDVVLKAMQMVIQTVTDNGKGYALVQLLGEDILRVQMLMEKWIEVTQPGEASPSPA